MKYIAVLVLTLVVVGCGLCGEPPIEPKSLAFYLTQDKYPHKSGQIRTDPDSLALSTEPFLDLSGIESYDWETHTITLTEAQRDRFVADFRIGERKPFIHGGFVSVANGERVYVGYLSSLLSSCLSRGYPVAMLPFGLENRTLTIERNESEIDVRSDERIRRVLEEAGLLAEKEPKCRESS